MSRDFQDLIWQRVKTLDKEKNKMNFIKCLKDCTKSLHLSTCVGATGQQFSCLPGKCI